MSRNRYLTPIIIYILAATPIPDYILLIPLGVIRYPFWKMIWPMLLGKITQNFYFALIGKYSLGQIDFNIAGGGFYIGLSSLIIIFGAIYMVMRIDWDQLIDRWAARQENKDTNLIVK